MSNGTASTGQMLELAAAVTRALPRDIESDCAQYWVEPHGEELTTLLRQVLSRSKQLVMPAFSVVKHAVVVNYGLALDKAIKAGSYDWADPNITAEHFPAKRTGKAELNIELLHFGKDISSDDVLAVLDAQGLRPAEPRELLALGATHPELQREFPIIALGSVWQGPGSGRRVAYLDGSGSERSLDLHWFVDGWNERCRFAAVRK